MLVAQSCLTLCDPMDCGPPGSPVHWIFQARILEWVTISYSRDLPNPWVNPSRLHLLHGQEDSLPLSRLASPSWRKIY